MVVKADKLTPMMEQYMRLKKELNEAILLFRLGDFYEMFFEDAKLCSRLLQITLTSRAAKGKKVPMCGVPHHAVENYLNRLLRQGYKVGICEQVEDPAVAKGLVKREITRIITPGTILSPGLLEEKENNYLMAICREGDNVGIAFVDLSTGDFKTGELNKKDTVRSPAVSYTPESGSDTQAVKEHVEAYLDDIMGPMNIVGQVKDTYLIMEKDDGIELIDQHVAHERILYEGLKRDLSKGRIEKQALLFPLSLELGLKEALFLREKIDWFLELGMEIEEFGKNTFNVRTLPGRVKAEKARDFILGLIGELVEVSGQRGITDLRDEALKIMACRSAIMAGDKLGAEERIKLLRELEKCQDNITCPHGRPIRVHFAWNEIEKRFKR